MTATASAPRFPAAKARIFAALATLAAVGSVLLAAATPNARADSPATAVLDWNAHAIAALGNAPGAATPGAGQSPPVMALHLGMVQGAVYDAVNSIDGGHESYLDVDSQPSGASQAAATATAAQAVLASIIGQVPISGAFTTTVRDAILARLVNLRNDSIAAATSSDGAIAVGQGVTAGQAAAAAMIAERTGDGRYPSTPPSPPVFVAGAEPGQWRPLASGTDPFAWVARVEPFAVESGAQFMSKGPRDLESGAYAKEYDEVKTLGSVNNNSVLSTDQQAVRDFFTSNPVEMFNRSLRSYAADMGLDLAEQARLYGLIGLTGADTFITCWQDKSKWSFWRPTTAIQLGDSDGNAKTVGDPTWAAWATVPSYPDQSSGFNCATGAIMSAAEAFFGHGDTSFTVAKTASGPTRTYRHFRDVCLDTIDARVYQGLHFRTADEAGAQIGEDVAEWVALHYLRPAR